MVLICNCFFRILLMICLLTTGCSHKPEVELGEVTGVVKVDDKPASNITVEFWPVSGARPSTSQTNAQGVYNMSYSPDSKGVILGISTVKIAAGGYTDPADKDGMAIIPRKDLLIQENVEVKKGKNNFDFQVTLKK